MTEKNPKKPDNYPFKLKRNPELHGWRFYVSRATIFFRPLFLFLFSILAPQIANAQLSRKISVTRTASINLLFEVYEDRQIKETSQNIILKRHQILKW